MQRLFCLALLAAFAAALAPGCNKSSDSRSSGPPAGRGDDTFGDGVLPERFAVFLARSEDNAPDLPYFVDLDTGDSRALGMALNLGVDLITDGATLSPDGRILGLSIFDGDSVDFRLVSTTDGRSIELPYGSTRSTSPGGPQRGGDVGVGRFQFSQDSRFILFSTVDVGSRALWVMRRDGSGASSIQINGKAPYHQAWIPGTSIFLAIGDNSTDTGSIIRVTDAETLLSTDFSLLPSGDLYIDEIQMSKDGSKLAIAYAFGANDFVEVGCFDVATGAFTEFDSGTDDADEHELAISDDGRFVAFAVIDETSGENERVYLARTSDGATVRVDPSGPNPDPYAEELRFEPGGGRLAFLGDFEGGSTYDLYLAEFGAATINLTALGKNEGVETYEWCPAGPGPGRYLGAVADRYVFDEVLVFDTDMPNAAGVSVPLAASARPEELGWSGDGTSLLIEVDGVSSNGLQSWQVDGSAGSVTDLGPCARDTLRARPSYASFGNLGPFGQIEGGGRVAWIRDGTALGAEDLLVGDPQDPNATQVLTAPLAEGEFRAIRSLATRTGSAGDGGPVDGQ